MTLLEPDNSLQLLPINCTFREYKKHYIESTNFMWNSHWGWFVDISENKTTIQKTFKYFKSTKQSQCLPTIYEYNQMKSRSSLFNLSDLECNELESQEFMDNNKLNTFNYKLIGICIIIIVILCIILI
jgi:hypothetical protein